MKKSVKFTIIAIITALIIAIVSVVASSVYQNSPAYILSLAERYLNEMDYDQAIVQYERYLAVVPDNDQAWLALADAYEKSGDKEGAKSALERAVENADSNKAAEKLDDIKKKETAIVITTSAVTTAPATVTTIPFETVTETTPVTTLSPENDAGWMKDYELTEYDIELILSQLDFINFMAMNRNDGTDKFFCEGELTEEDAFSFIFLNSGESVLPMDPHENGKPDYRMDMDPYGLFYNGSGFGGTTTSVYNADYIDNILYHVFGIEATHHPKPQPRWYYYNESYYVLEAACGGIHRIPEYVKHTPTDDGRFIVEYDWFYSHNYVTEQTDYEKLRRYALVSAHEADGRVYIRYHAITNDLEGILETTSADIEVTTEPPVSPNDPLAVENMLLAYIKGTGSLNANMLSEVTELKIYGTQFVSVSCGSRTGTVINCTEFSSTNDTFVANGNTYSFGNFSDISFVKYCKKLSYLEISYNKVSDISALANLTGLTGLAIRGNRVSDISALKNLTQLKWLNITDNKVTDISAIKGLTGLEVLCISGNSIYDISPVKKLTGIEDFRAECNLIYDVSPLKKLKNLDTLLLTENEIEDVSSLESLKKLKVLGLSDNYVYELNGIEELTKLEVLFLENNDVQDLELLYELTNLEQVYLGTNPSVSNRDIDELRDYLPDCSISMDSFYSTGTWTHYNAWER